MVVLSRYGQIHTMENILCLHLHTVPFLYGKAGTLNVLCTAVAMY